MTYLSQLDQMRLLINQELLPRVVKKWKIKDTGVIVWKCDICKIITHPEQNQGLTFRSFAKHTTFCKLRIALGVIE